MVDRFIYTVFIYGKDGKEKTLKKVMVMSGEDKNVYEFVERLADHLDKKGVKRNIRVTRTTLVGAKEVWAVDLEDYSLVIEKEPIL